MSQSKWLAVLLGLALVAPGWADARGKKVSTEPTVEQLLEQLASKDFQVREKASKALGSLGKESLPALQKARNHPDPEVRRRLDELIPPLERAVTLSPKQITLHMTNKPLQDVLNELSKQTGHRFTTWQQMQGNGGVRDKVVYTFHFDKLPFWEALDKICEACGMTLQQNNWNGDDSMMLYQQDNYVPFGYYNGPFKVIATGFNYGRNNNFGQLRRTPGQPAEMASEYLHVSIQIGSEPRLPILRLGQVKLSVAEDDEGHSMLPRPDANNNQFGRQYYGGWYRSFLHQTQAPLACPSKSSRKVKTLKGSVPVTLLADQKPSIVTDRILASKGKKYKVGDATFHIEDVTEQPGKQYQIRIGVAENSKDGGRDYSRIQSMQQRLELQDEKGHKVPSYINITNWGGPTNAQFTIQVNPNGNAKVGAPAKLVYSSWVLMEHEVAFEFKDLPLP